MLGLDLVVELVGDPLADLGQHRARVEPRREALEDRADEPDAAQVGLDGLGGARVLHLDRHLLSVGRARAVHLAERGERERLLVEVGEQVPIAGVEVLLDHASSRGRRAPPARRRAARRRGGSPSRRVELEHREELRDLRPGALQPAELRPEVLGQREGARVVARAVRLLGHRRATALPSGRRRPAPARVVSMKSISTPDEAQRIVEVREMARVGKDLEPAARHEPMGRARVLDRDDRVALAPDEQERDRLGEVEAIARVHPLTQRIDDRPQRVQERRARLAVRERRVTAQDLAQVGVHAQPDAAEQASHRPAGAEEPLVDQQREHELGARAGWPRAEAGVISRPSPPLSTSTSRSQCSGNWYASCIATPPPSECPTNVARSCPSAISRSRIPLAYAPSE